MPATKDDVVAAVRAVREELERIASSAGDDTWSKPAYEGWTARELLCHIAATSNVTGFLLAMARNPGATFSGEADNDAFNAQQLTARSRRSIAELLEEARGYLDADVERVAAAPDELLSTHYRAPWGAEGVLSDVMRDALREHLMMHLRDLARAVGT